MIEVLLIDCHPDDWKDRLVHYLRVLNAAGRVSATVDHRSVNAGFPVPSVQAAVITGSPMMLAEELPRAGLCEFVQSLTCPVLGICFGHQLLGLLSGSKVYRGEKIEGIRTVRAIGSDPLLSGLDGEVDFLESHQEFLKKEEVEASGWEVLAASDSCPVEAMRHRTKPWYGVQFHPEQSKQTGEKLVSNFVRLVGRV